MIWSWLNSIFGILFFCNEGTWFWEYHFNYSIPLPNFLLPNSVLFPWKAGRREASQLFSLLSYLSGLWSKLKIKQKPHVGSENTQLILLGQCLSSFDVHSNHLGTLLKCSLIQPLSGWEQRSGIAISIKVPEGAPSAAPRTIQEVVGSTDSPRLSPIVSSVCTAPAVPGLRAKAALLHHQQPGYEQFLCRQFLHSHNRVVLSNEPKISLAFLGKAFMGL